MEAEEEDQIKKKLPKRSRRSSIPEIVGVSCLSVRIDIFLFLKLH